MRHASSPLSAHIRAAGAASGLCLSARLLSAPATADEAVFRPLLESDRGALLRGCRMRGVEPPIALLDSAGPLVPGNSDADMVRANALACGGDFVLRLAVCQGKDLIAKAW